MAKFGVYGYYSNDNNNHVSMTCPNGSYMQYVRGKGGDNVDSIQGISCRNAVTGAVSSVNAPVLGGGGGKDQGSPINCTASAFDGLAGFQAWRGGELNGLVGKCGNPDGSNHHYSGSIGSAKEEEVDGDWCPTGQMVYTIEGGPSNRGDQVSQFYWQCKDIQSMRNIATDAAARGKCVIGDDGSSSCTEIKSSLSDSGDDKNAYCASGTNVVNSQNCRAFYNQDLNNAAYRSAMMAYCSQGDNYTTDVCKTFCTSSSDDGTPAKGACDALYAAKCKGNPSALCSCLQDWSTYPGSASIDALSGAPQRPDCYFANCISNGYKKQQSENCPQCVQTIQAQGGVNSLTIGNIVQSCTVAGAATLAPAPTVAPAAGGPAPTAAAQAQTGQVVQPTVAAKKAASMSVILLGTLLVVIIAIIIFVVI